jgi:hypothetical protein
LQIVPQSINLLERAFQLDISSLELFCALPNLPLELLGNLRLLTQELRLLNADYGLIRRYPD